MEEGKKVIGNPALRLISGHLELEGIEIDKIIALIDKHEALLRELRDNLDELRYATSDYKIRIITQTKETN